VSGSRDQVGQYWDRGRPARNEREARTVFRKYSSPTWERLTTPGGRAARGPGHKLTSVSPRGIVIAVNSFKNRLAAVRPSPYNPPPDCCTPIDIADCRLLIAD
jgi:hypothetical protein